jgi:hypothetical protein
MSDTIRAALETAGEAARVAGRYDSHCPGGFLCTSPPCRCARVAAEAVLAALGVAPEAVRLELARRLAGEAWAVVPKEPTRKMIDALNGYAQFELTIEGRRIEDGYRAMVAAAKEGE